MLDTAFINIKQTSPYRFHLNRISQILKTEGAAIPTVCLYLVHVCVCFFLPGKTFHLFPFRFEGSEVSFPVLYCEKVFLHQSLHVHLTQNHPLL